VILVEGRLCRRGAYQSDRNPRAVRFEARAVNSSVGSLRADHVSIGPLPIGLPYQCMASCLGLKGKAFPVAKLGAAQGKFAVPFGAGEQTSTPQTKGFTHRYWFLYHRKGPSQPTACPWRPIVSGRVWSLGPQADGDKSAVIVGARQNRRVAQIN
jgi:hypothetical protein